MRSPASRCWGQGGLGPARELYDLESDAMDTVNLANRPAFRSVLEELEARRRGGWRAARP